MRAIIWDPLLSNDGAVGIIICRRTAVNANTAPPPAPSLRLLPRRRDSSIDRTERNDNIRDVVFPKESPKILLRTLLFLSHTVVMMDAIYQMCEQEARVGRWRIE